MISNTPSSRPFLYLAGTEVDSGFASGANDGGAPSGGCNQPRQTLKVCISLASFDFTLFLVPLVENLCAVPEALRRRCLLVDPWW